MSRSARACPSARPPPGFISSASVGDRAHSSKAMPSARALPCTPLLPHLTRGDLVGGGRRRIGLGHQLRPSAERDLRDVLQSSAKEVTLSGTRRCSRRAPASRFRHRDDRLQRLVSALRLALPHPGYRFPFRSTDRGAERALYVHGVSDDCRKPAKHPSARRRHRDALGSKRLRLRRARSRRRGEAMIRAIEAR